MLSSQHSALGLLWPWQAEFWTKPAIEIAEDLRLRARPLTPSPSILQPPPAPRTQTEMRTWTPEALFSTIAERAAEQRRTMEQLGAGGRPGDEDGAPKKELSPWLIGGLVIGGLSVLLLLRG